MAPEPSADVGSHDAALVPTESSRSSDASGREREYFGNELERAHDELFETLHQFERQENVTRIPTSFGTVRRGYEEGLHTELSNDGSDYVDLRIVQGRLVFPSAEIVPPQSFDLEPARFNISDFSRFIADAQFSDHRGVELRFGMRTQRGFNEAAKPVDLRNTTDEDLQAAIEAIHQGGGGLYARDKMPHAQILLRRQELPLFDLDFSLDLAPYMPEGQPPIVFREARFSGTKAETVPVVKAANTLFQGALVRKGTVK